MFERKLRGWLLLGIVVLAVACQGEQLPVEVVRSFFTAVETFDVAKAESLVCQAQRHRVRESLTPFSDIAAPGEAFDIRFGELVIQEQSNDGKISVVRVKGQLTLFFLGQQETQGVDETHTLVKDHGRWLICGP
jgi:hypothetical protein